MFVCIGLHVCLELLELLLAVSHLIILKSHRDIWNSSCISWEYEICFLVSATLVQPSHCLVLHRNNFHVLGDNKIKLSKRCKFEYVSLGAYMH